ncbi:M20/M25/M40 family metallo-hydrolase [Rhizobium nepotum]
MFFICQPEGGTNGTAILIFQPAEEGQAGAKAMCELGADIEAHSL